MCLANFCSQVVTLYETNIAPDTGCLEDDCFCVWDGFNREGTRVLLRLVSGRVFLRFFLSVLLMVWGPVGLSDLRSNGCTTALPCLRLRWFLLCV